MAQRPATIYVVDDDTGCRTSLGRLLRAAGYETRFYASGEEILGDPMAGGMPGCLILDLIIPSGMCGLELLERLAAAGRRCPTIVLTACSVPEKAFSAGKLGANIFLRKPVNEIQLLRSIKKVLAASCSKELPRAVRRRKAQRLLATLSPRERQTLALLKDKRSRKKVAAEMGIAYSTVKYYCDNIFRKLAVHSLRAALDIWNAARADF